MKNYFQHIFCFFGLFHLFEDDFQRKSLKTLRHNIRLQVKAQSQIIPHLEK
jgi:hypothetical protein